MLRDVLMPKETNDPKLPISDLGPAEAYDPKGKEGAINPAKPISPTDPGSMPRAEDDETTFARSPEYHDRPTAGPRHE